MDKLLSIQEKPIAEETRGVPLIFGDFNDWQPEPMLEIFSFSENIDRKLDVE